MVIGAFSNPGHPLAPSNSNARIVITRLVVCLFLAYASREGK